MVRSKLTPVFVVLVAMTLFVSGMLAYKLATGSTASPGAPARGAGAQSDLLTIEGRALIQVYRADGTLSATWRGHNSLTDVGRNAIVACVTGLSTAPNGYARCSNLVPNISVFFTTIGIVGKFSLGAVAAVSTPLPSGCSVTSWTPPACNGWTTQATLPVPNNANGNDSTVVTLGAGDQGSAMFDDISVSPGLVVHVGDRVAVTITFTVS
jgi:hypothetical protein